MVNYSYIENLMTNLILKLQFNGYICKNHFSFIINNRLDLIVCFYYLLCLITLNLLILIKRKKKVWGLNWRSNTRKWNFCNDGLWLEKDYSINWVGRERGLLLCKRQWLINSTIWLITAVGFLSNCESKVG